MKKMITLALVAALASQSVFTAFAAETEAGQTTSEESFLSAIFDGIQELEETLDGSSLDTAKLTSELTALASQYGLDDALNGGENQKLVSNIIDAFLDMKPEALELLQNQSVNIDDLITKAIDNYEEIKDALKDTEIEEDVKAVLSEAAVVSAYWDVLKDSIDVSYGKSQEDLKDFEDMTEMEDALESEMAALSDDTDFDEDTDDFDEDADDFDEVDYGDSDLYTKEDMDAAIEKIMDEFNTWECTDLDLTYAGDDYNSEENLTWLDSLSADENFTECIAFTSSFHSPKSADEFSAWKADTDYDGWEWWLGRTDDGEWHLVTWGY